MLVMDVKFQFNYPQMILKPLECFRRAIKWTHRMHGWQANVQINSYTAIVHMAVGVAFALQPDAFLCESFIMARVLKHT